MSFELSIQYDNQEVVRKTNQIRTTLKNLRVPLLQAKDFVFKETDKQFTTKGANLGTPWKPAAHNYGHPLLQKTKTMRNAFKWTPISPKTGVTLYNGVDYFKYHQSSRPRTKLPRREMFVLNDKLRKGIVEIFKNYLAKQI